MPHCQASEYHHRNAIGQLLLKYGDIILILQGSTVHTSDARLKKDILTIPDALTRIMQLRGVGFRWMDQEKDAAMGPQLGVIAQEVEAVFPEAVLQNKEGFKAVAYSKLVAPLIEAVKAQQHMIENQQQIIEQQKKSHQEEIATLKSMIQQMGQQMTSLTEEMQILKAATNAVEPAHPQTAAFVQ